jgi:hypothetical protein
MQRFDAIDADHNGVITREEFMEFHARKGGPEGRGEFRGERRQFGRDFERREGPPPPGWPRGPRPGDEPRGPRPGDEPRDK